MCSSNSNFTVPLQQTSCDYGIENSSTRASRDGAAWLWGGELGGSVEVGSRASRPPPSVADLFQSQAVLDAKLTRPSSTAANMGDRRDQRRKMPSFRPPQSKTDHDGENYDGEGVDA